MRRLLIVDDEPSVRDDMAALLLDAGYSVQTAADGQMALEIIVLAPPDLIITNVMMPNLDGWALLDGLHERNPSLPVILMRAGAWVRRRRHPSRITLSSSASRFPSRSCWSSSCA